MQRDQLRARDNMVDFFCGVGWVPFRLMTCWLIVLRREVLLFNRPHTERTEKST